MPILSRLAALAAPPLALAALALLLTPGRASGQDAPDPDPTTLLHDRLREAERAHLKRVAVWGAANVAAGTALALSTDREERPTLHAFGLQSAGWGLINTGIAAAGLTLGGRGDPPSTPGEALGAEARWGQILVVNQGLNAGYMMVGAALWAASGHGLRRGDEVKGHAQAVILQGMGLFVLDGVAWLGHRERMGAFRRWLDGAEVTLVPGAAITLRVPVP